MTILRPSRRAVLLGGIAAVAAAMPRLRAMANVSPEALIERARRLSQAPHRDTTIALVPPFDSLTYDSFRGIRPRPGGAGELEIGGGVRMDLLPPGFYFRDRVEVVVPGQDTPLDFDPSLFTFEPRYFPEPPQPAPGMEEMGFSGIRLRGPLNRPDIWDEFLVMQGASYFRALPADTVYGLSARGLALGTGGSTPEEFPVFTRLEVDPTEQGAVRIGALIESPSATGALIFAIRPGAPTVMDCELTLFPRRNIAEAGIAPLTSMYFFGPLRRSVADDFRPAVHDSDVLWIENGAGETVVRPLSNPAQLQISAFSDTGPRRFGLLQTLRDYEDYVDPEAAYHRRPSAWVEPVGDWGPGAVTLVEIPTADEYHDNIVAFWRPAEPLMAGGEYRFAYRLVWSGAAEPGHGFPLAVAASRSGRDPLTPGARLFVVDYRADGVQPDPAAMSLKIESLSGEGQITGQSFYAPGEPGLYRASFLFTPAEGQTVAELRLVIGGADGAPASPVWLHRWTMARDGGV
ncbi:glucan biosynthesis protein [Halovulum dunhuangense]|uniref:Glucan biosynthesis protein n=1 Tax=Halovulum dunhuangense TaxID=1505036 RepID=A0A849KYR9_9RHOB|nr:glucan biosynthesis protein G [Halovulum dunhuangense]NNU79446.1 glucan biosynthesis protein [Halovulum dunhuangense]